MKKLLLLLLGGLLCCNMLHAQFLLVDDMEGHGPGSGRWSYYAGPNATGNVLFNVPNPAPSSINPSSHVAKFTKDTTCFEYMSASCGLTSTFDLSGGAVFKMLVYSNVREEVMFKLQPGTDYTKAVFFTYKVKNVNQWEEAVFNFQSVANRTDFNRIAIQFIDGRKANGILYFDLVQAPNPINITFLNTRIPMGHEHGAVIPVKLNGAVFKPALTSLNWYAENLPPGVSIDSIQRVSDTTANIVLAGNSPANYSRTTLKLTVAGQEVEGANTPSYSVKGNAIFEGNPAWTMIYNDEFNIDGVPDRSKWTVDPQPKGWINGEQQVYTDSTHDNARVRNGDLVITGKRDFPNGTTTEPWSSARVISQNKMDLLYGKVEVRAKLPKARGSWPAIWMMPTSSVYGGWPKSGEIDILEHIGNQLGRVMSTVHTENNNWTNGGHLTGFRNFPDAHTAYHTYSVEWSPDSLRFTFDSLHIYTYVNPQTDWKDWPFDQKFHIILNLAIGGGMGGTIVQGDWPDSMNVDYVRVYQKGLGTPYPDTVIVTPANQLVLAGKTVQYTAKVLDQNGHVMSLTPQWSITGAGNTISATGLAAFDTSGIVTATAVLDTISVSGSAYANVRIPNYKPIPARIEAEAFDNSNSCCTEPTQDTSGTVNVSYIGKGTWFDYDIDVPDGNRYRVQLRAAVSAATSANIYLDTVLLATMKLPASGGWQKWITVSSPKFRLKQGRQTIRVYSNASGWNYNWLRIVDADSVVVSNVVVTPDSVTLKYGETQQYSAKAFDQRGDIVSFTPEWKLTGGDTANAVNQQGLFTAGSSTGWFKVKARDEGATGMATVKIVPVPVLTRVTISPRSATVPVDASQAFLITGYDQFDSIMPVPAQSGWAVTGPRNRVSSAGVFTAGDSIGTFMITFTSGSAKDTVYATTAWTCTVNDHYEAESASSVAGGSTLQACTDVGGGQNYTNLASGHRFTYSNLNVPSPGRYIFRIRISSTYPGEARIGHSGMVFGVIKIPNTSGQWRTISDTVTLPALTTTNITVGTGGFKFNWFSLENCAPEIVRVDLSPDTTDVTSGNTLPFKLTAYDAANNAVMLPVTEWTTTGAGNAVSSLGMFTAGATAGSYTVTAKVRGFSVSALVNVVNTLCTVNNRHEAEVFSNRHAGPYLQPCTDVGGGQNFAGLATGHWFSYDDLNVPTAGVYTVSVRVNSTSAGQIGIGHGGVTFGLIDVPNTGGTWQTVRDTMTLPALTYTGVNVKAGTFKYNWFSIDNCSAIPVEPAPLIAMAHKAEPEDAAPQTARAYPNPVSGNVTIDLPEGFRTVTLFDLQGRAIRQWSIQQGETRLVRDLSFLKDGFYFIKLEGKRKTEMIRIIKQ
ncbi:carbohydrate-binding protein [Chitinophaga barathri]|uniref:Carbohydrate-binding protein n=1 Tax=Chitinophaga barathri TaxID=1647451 RepID=A0A3N4M7T8_9BACT|nr:carbohydrate-binding protein [Chitinophaga barathri]RPD39614.1 carbohydrate-binding protein [Chitinophaga barathri]